MGRPRRWLSARVFVYPLMLALILGLFLFLLGTRSQAEVTLLRGLGAPYVVQADGGVVNQIRFKIVNRGRADRSYRIEIVGADEARVIAPVNPLPVPAGGNASTSVFVILPPRAFVHGERSVTLRLSDGAAARALPYRLVGPEDGAGTPQETR